MIQRTSFTLLVALSLQAVAQGQDATAEQFGKSVVQSNIRLRKAGFDVGKQLGPLLNNGNEVDAAALGSRYATLVKTLGQVKREMQKPKLPDSPEAKALYEAHQQFLKGQGLMIEDGLARVVIVALDPDKKIDQKKDEIQELIDEMTKREEADGKKLLPALQAYVTKYQLDVDNWLEE